MYIPKYSEVTDPRLIEDFIRKHPFAMLIEHKSDLCVNHYPFLIKKENDKLILWTHLAKANPQWISLQNNKECMVVFTGPEAYISPTYYSNPLNVPTWSYTAVHVKCLVSIESNEAIQVQLMRELVSHFESLNQSNWSYDLPIDFHQKLLKSIVWIKCEATNLEAKFKLSQNRNLEDYQSLVRHLKNKKDSNTEELLYYMNLTSSIS